MILLKIIFDFLGVKYPINRYLYKQFFNDTKFIIFKSLRDNEYMINLRDEIINLRVYVARSASTHIYNFHTCDPKCLEKLYNIINKSELIEFLYQKRFRLRIEKNKKLINSICNCDYKPRNNNYNE